MSHVSHTNESCLTHQWDMSQIWTNHRYYSSPVCLCVYVYVSVRMCICICMCKCVRVSQFPTSRLQSTRPKCPIYSAKKSPYTPPKNHMYSAKKSPIQWPFQVWDMTHSYARQVICTCQKEPDIFHKRALHTPAKKTPNSNSFMYETWLIHTQDDSFIPA